MNTPAHLIFAATAFAQPDNRRRSLAALMGGFAPDFSLYALTAVSTLLLGIPAQTVFRELYYSPAWQQVFAIDNSFILWGVALTLSIWRRHDIWMVFCAAALLHLALDFPLHNHDARPHFWPLTDWVFISPFSYWDRAHHGDIVGWIEWAACAGCLFVLWRRFQGFVARVLIALGAVLQLLPTIIWRLIL
ncbi:MAG: cobalamin biosynthesis protein CobQ [Pseudomonadota bacterium]